MLWSFVLKFRNFVVGGAQRTLGGDICLLTFAFKNNEGFLNRKMLEKFYFHNYFM